MNIWLKKYKKKCIERLEIEIAKYNLFMNETKKEITYGESRGKEFFGSENEKQLYERLTKHTHNLNVIKKTLKELTTETLDNQFSQIYKHPKINKIEIKNSNDLCIETKKLKVKGSNIGNFKIIITQNTINIKNLEHKVGSNDHWHIQDGDPCFGDWGTLLNKYFHTGNILLYIDTLIHYLLSPGDDHAYIKRAEWMKHFKNKTVPDRIEPFGSLTTTGWTVTADSGDITTNNDYISLFNP